MNNPSDNMNKKLIREKGYTLVVESFENDGDDCETHFFKANSKEEALALKKMCETLFGAYHDSSKGLSNDCKDSLSKKDKEIILEFVKENPIVIERFLKDKEPSDEKIISAFKELSYDHLIGYSEYYTFRVCDSCSIEYAAEDIFVEEIN